MLYGGLLCSGSDPAASTKKGLWLHPKGIRGTPAETRDAFSVRTKKKRSAATRPITESTASLRFLSR